MFVSKFGVVFRGLEKISGPSVSLVSPTLRKFVDKPTNTNKPNTPNPPKVEEDCDRLFKGIIESHEKAEKRKSRKIKKGLNCNNLGDPCKSKFEDPSPKDDPCAVSNRPKDDIAKGNGNGNKSLDVNKPKEGQFNNDCLKIKDLIKQREGPAKDDLIKAKDPNKLKEIPDLCQSKSSILKAIEENKEKFDDDIISRGVQENCEPEKPKLGCSDGKRKSESSNNKQTPPKVKKDAMSTKTNNNNTNKSDSAPKKKGKELKMKALVYKAFDQDLCLREVDIPPAIKKDEVMIKVQFAGVSQTDFAILDGIIPAGKEQFIPGREFSGTVCGCGEQVEHVKAGDNVTVAPCIPGSVCRFCAEEKAKFCVKEGGSDKAMGLDRDGGWAEYSVVPGNIVYKVPEGTNELSATLLPILAQVLCIMSRLQINPSKDILILGGGLPGCLTALVLQNNAFANVVICEDNPNKVKQLEALGTGYSIINLSKMNGMEFDVVLSSGAGTNAMQKAMNALRPQGQFVVFGTVGGYQQVPEVKVPITELSKKQITIHGMMGTPSNPTNIPAAIISSALSIEKLGIEVFPIKSFKEALSRVQTGDAGYALLQLKGDS